MKPLIHAKNSVRKFGGKVEDYLFLHNWMDSTKGYVPDMRHRMVLHNAWGIMMGEQVHGVYFKNSDGKDISVRDVLEQHVVDDLGHIPTLEKCMASLVAEPWMGSSQFSGVKIRVPVNKTNITIVD